MVATIESALRVALPSIQHRDTALYSSQGDERIDIRHLAEWASFERDVLEALAQYTDLGVYIVHSNSEEPENYNVGNEIGITSRVIQNLCIPLNRAWEAYRIPIAIGDYQSAGPAYGSSRQYPDLIFANYSSPCPIKAAIVLKTPWTLFLERATITSAAPARRGLEIPLGNSVIYIPFVGTAQLKNQQESWFPTCARRRRSMAFSPPMQQAFLYAAWRISASRSAVQFDMTREVLQYGRPFLCLRLGRRLQGLIRSLPTLIRCC